MKRLTYLSLWVSIQILTACAHTMSMDQDTFASPVDETREVVESPGSLWAPDARFVDMYADARARRVGDIVVVQIVESSSAEKEAKTKTDRTNKVDSSITNLLGIPLDRASVLGYKLSPTAEASASSEFEGNGKTSRKGDITGTVSVRVMRVLPSGNMVINGKKQIRVNGEIQYIILSGIVRSEDISAGNTIQSTYIADMRLDYYGTGIMGDQQDRGLFSKVLDKIWPF